MRAFPGIVHDVAKPKPMLECDFSMYCEHPPPKSFMLCSMWTAMYGICYQDCIELNEGDLAFHSSPVIKGTNLAHRAIC